jgi:hypothetical protein
VRVCMRECARFRLRRGAQGNLQHRAAGRARRMMQLPAVSRESRVLRTEL